MIFQQILLGVYELINQICSDTKVKAELTFII